MKTRDDEAKDRPKVRAFGDQVGVSANRRLDDLVVRAYFQGRRVTIWLGILVA